MCDLSDKLVAWVDHELPHQETADLEQHLHGCAECRRCVAAYKQISEAINEYCDAAIESPVRIAFPRWTPVLFAAAAGIALLLLFPRVALERRPAQTQVAAGSAVVAEAPLKTTLAASPSVVQKRVHKRRITAPAQVQNANWIPAEPAIQIAIPAEAMFAPGAVPQGVSFSAVLTIAADGSAQQLRLRP
jgi:anti-sigma factor RsiW